MPLYEYQCTACEDRVEILQKMNDPPHSVCERCGAAMKKQFSSPAIQFKGSGFYKTDYAPTVSSPAAGAKSEGASDSKSEAKADSKADSKAESQSDANAGSKTETKSESKSESKGDASSQPRSDSKSESSAPAKAASSKAD